MADSKPIILTCSRCGIGVPADKVAIKDRCNDQSCPLNERVQQTQQSTTKTEPTLLSAG